MQQRGSGGAATDAPMVLPTARRSSGAVYGGAASDAPAVLCTALLPVMLRRCSGNSGAPGKRFAGQFFGDDHRRRKKTEDGDKTGETHVRDTCHTLEPGDRKPGSPGGRSALP